MQNPTATISEQQAKVMGNSPTDTLRNASTTDDKKKKEIKKKAIQGATKGKKDTNVDVAKLNTPEEVLEKYKDTQRLFAQEGVIPVKENMSEENQMSIIKRLRDEGYSDTAVSAIMGNIDVETGGSFSHTQQQEGGKGYGILQLDFQRPYYDTYLKDNNKEDSLNSQLDYFINEINTGSVIGAGNAEQLRNIFGNPNASVEDMTTMLVDRFFKPGKPNLDRRIESAKMRLDNMKTKAAEQTPLMPEQIPQMAEGGLTENNDDTLGATEKEVADDIPAQISEGELVVPANVVRYHGLSTYESLRQSALLGLEGLEDEGQLKKVDENGIPVEEDKKEDKEKDTIKVQTVKMLSAKEGGFPDLSGDGKVTRKDVLLGRGVNLKEGGFPDLSGDGEVTQKDILMGRGVNLQEGGLVEEPKTNFPEPIRRPVDPNDPRFKDDIRKPIPKPRGKSITIPDRNDPTKGTMITPEKKEYRVTMPDTKITAQGPRTQNIVGGNYTGVDLENMPGFGKTSSSVTAPSPSTTEKLLSGVATVAALDKLFFDGAITDAAYTWAKKNIFDPVGKFLGFDKTAAANAGILTSGATAAMTATSITVGNTIVPIGSTLTPIGAAAEAGGIIPFRGSPGTAFTTVIDGKTIQLTPGEAYIVSGGQQGVYDGNLTNVNTSGSASTKVGADLTGESPVVTSQDGLFSWKGGLATIGATLSLYDIIENGPSVANVAGLGAGVGGMINAGVFGLGSAGALGSGAMGSALAAAAGPLAVIAIAAGLVEAFSGPPSNKVAEAAINFDNPEYKESDILIGGFTGKKFSEDNTDAVTQLSASIGSYVSSMEQALEINIGGELFLDVGSTRGLRYGYVDGYDKLDMYKYHKKDTDYKLLSGTGQTGKGYRGEDAVTDLMNDIQDDTNVVVMFALADKAAGGEGYATYDNLPLYRKKINTLSTYRPSMAGSNSKAVLTEQERNILQGFQQKEFAEVTGEELAVVLTLYDKIAPVHTQNQYQGFSYQGM